MVAGDISIIVHFSFIKVYSIESTFVVEEVISIFVEEVVDKLDYLHLKSI